MALPNGVKHERALGHYVVSLDGLELSNHTPSAQKDQYGLMNVSLENV